MLMNVLTQEEEEEDLVNNLLTIPPGFERGVQIEESNLGSIEDEPKNIQVNNVDCVFWRE